jgi:taurine dioxygenase
MAAPKTITVNPLTPVIGAEIGGVDLSKSPSAEQFAEIRAAFNAYHVIYFRDQHLSREDHKRFGRMFGRLHVHPYHAKNTAPAHAETIASSKPNDPEILVVKADANSKYVAGEEWHTDVSCDEEPPMGSMLYITTTPEGGGGDTCFLSTVAAYEALSPKMKAFAESLTAVHDGAKPYTGAYGAKAPEGGWPRTTHPVITRHPDTGRKALFVNRGFTMSAFSKSARYSTSCGNICVRCRMYKRPGSSMIWPKRSTNCKGFCGCIRNVNRFFITGMSSRSCSRFRFLSASVFPSSISRAATAACCC